MAAWRRGVALNMVASITISIISGVWRHGENHENINGKTK